MKFRLIALVLASISLITVIETHAQADNAALSKRSADLANAVTPTDSLPILYDIFDIVKRASKPEVGRRIYELAGRLKRADVQLDMMRQLANLHSSSDSVINIILEEAKCYPSSSEQIETVTFITSLRELTRARRASESERQKRLAALLQSIKRNDAGDKLDERRLNDKIVQLFTICVYLSYTSQDEMLAQTLERLNELIDKTPARLYAVRNLFYTFSALAYTERKRHDRAVAADRQLLRIIADLEKRYRREGRKYRDYSVSKYICNRRMLYNAEVLSRHEIDSIHRAVNILALSNSDIADNIRSNQREPIFYYVATENWAKALPLLKEHVDNPLNKELRPRMLHDLIKASMAMGDTVTELAASREYLGILEEYIRLRSTDSYNELRVLTEINNLRERNALLQSDHQSAMNTIHHWFVIVYAVLLPLLILAIVGLLVLYRRTRGLTLRLTKSNVDLKNERDNVVAAQRQLIVARDTAQIASRQKTEFINNMSHEIITPLNSIADYSRLIADCVTDDKRSYLAKYVNLIELNNELVQRIVADVLDIAEIDNNRMDVRKKPHSVNDICNLVVNTVRPTARPGVTVRFERPERPDLIADTDHQRVEQVLINLMRNSVKFTHEGSVVLDYSISDNDIVFSVEDTGIGIPPDKDEIVFERFEKLDRSTQGVGLGLPVSRLIARLLGGSVRIDRSDSRRRGTRMLFTIPRSRQSVGLQDSI